jgi:hypothetical protein
MEEDFNWKRLRAPYEWATGVGPLERFGDGPVEVFNEFPKPGFQIFQGLDFWWTSMEHVNSVMTTCGRKIEAGTAEIIEQYMQYGIASIIAAMNCRTL